MISTTHDPELNIIRAVLDFEGFDTKTLRRIKAEYFTDPTYATVWGYIIDHWQTYGKVPDITTVTKEFPTVAQLIVRARPVEPPAFYADKIVEAYVQHGVAQRLMQVLPGLATDVTGTLEQIRHVLGEYDLAMQEGDVMTMASTGQERLDIFQLGTPLGVPYPWPKLEHATMGAQDGELIVFVARPGMGKTHLLLKMAKHAWEENYRPLVIATEVPAMNMLFRVDAQVLGVDYDLFKKRQLSDVQRERYISFLKDTPRGEDFLIYDGMGMTPSALAVLIEQTKPSVVFVDGVYMLESDRKYKEDWQKFRHVAVDLKKIAQRYQVPVVVNSQFGRNVGTVHSSKGRKHTQGGVEDIGYGDAFGHYADLIVAISRTVEDVEQDTLTLRVIKGREVADGLTWKVSFDFSTMKFNEVDWQELAGSDSTEDGSDPHEVVW